MGRSPLAEVLEALTQWKTSSILWCNIPCIRKKIILVVGRRERPFGHLLDRETLCVQRLSGAVDEQLASYGGTTGLNGSGVGLLSSLLSGCLLLAFWLLSARFPVAFCLHSDCFLLAFWLRSGCCLVALRLLSALFLLAFCLLSGCFVVALRLRSG